MEYLSADTTAIAIIMVFLIKEMFAFLREKRKETKIDLVQEKVDNDSEIRLAKIEERLCSMEKLTSNHVKHIQKDIEIIREDITRICNRLDK
jgi:low affinity Fe/Cu permease